MNLFVTHQIVPAKPQLLVHRAVGVAGLEPEDVRCEPLEGPALSGWPALWWRWELGEGVPDAVVPSALDEDDPEDAPYPTRSGVVALVVGLPTGYVSSVQRGEACGVPELIGFIERSAQHPFFAPPLLG